MKKLEYKDVCGYLPHDLKIMDNERETVYPFLGYEIDTTLTKILLYDEETDWWDLSNFKPILRPATDLYKPITHNGKEIVPIVELAKIAGFKDCTNAMRPNRHGDYIALSDEGHFKFAYLSKDCAFAAQIGVMILQTAKNQYQLFDYLHELKIDYRGLIDAGLAISVHDLEFNPYN